MDGEQTSEEPDLSEDEVHRAVEDVALDPFFAGESEDFRNTVRMIVAAIYLGPNADNLARFLGLNRDKFVRPRAKRLRENGIFIEGGPESPGKVGVDADTFESEQKFTLWLVLAGLVAEGLAVRHAGSQI